MKVSCTQKNLSEGLSIVSRISTTKATLPILANILISTDKGRLKLAATDLELGITTWINSKINQDGGITIPARTITDFINTNSDKTIDLELNDTTLKLKSEHYDAHIKGMDIADYPLIPEIKDNLICEISSEKLKQAINQTVFAASNDETRPILCGVNFRFNSNEVKLVATDSCRLAEVKIKDVKTINEHSDVVVPVRTIVELGRIIQNTEEKVQIFLNDSQICFIIGSTQLISRLVEGTFPVYEQIIPNSFQTKVQIKSSELSSALKMSSLFTKESANNVKIKVKENTLQILAVSPQLGDNTANISSKTDGGELEIAFNARFILDAMNIISSEEVILELNEINPAKERKPSILKTPDNPNYLYIIMPLDIQG